jgi:hypothetical protein
MMSSRLKKHPLVVWLPFSVSLLLTFDLFAKRSVSLDKRSMEIHAIAASFCQSRKVVEVQLPTKRFVLGLVKVQRHDFSDKLAALMHFERNTIRSP